MQTTTQIPLPAHHDARREVRASTAATRLDLHVGLPESPAGATTAPDLRAALAGADPTTWAAVTAQYQTLISSRARRHRLTPDEAADVAQQTWLRLFENADRVRDPQRLAGWLATTANREAINVRQRAWREQPRPDTGTVWDRDESHEPDCDARVDTERRARALRAAIAELPTRQRRLIELLLEPEPPTYAEISTRLDMPIGSVGPIRARALHRLRQRLQALEGGNPTPASPPTSPNSRTSATGGRDPG
jgi:RNA polymerase sigma factor (sigma-70 family)